MARTARFHVATESTEDTFGATTDDLQEAIRIAKEVARSGQVGDLVLVESNDKGIKQFTLTKDGIIAEYQIPQ
jgi:hypothetical protein